MPIYGVSGLQLRQSENESHFEPWTRKHRSLVLHVFYQAFQRWVRFRWSASAARCWLQDREIVKKDFRSGLIVCTGQQTYIATDELSCLSLGG